MQRRLTVSSHWTHNLKCTYIRRSYVPYMNITITSSKHLMYVKFRSCKAQPGHPRISKMNRFPGCKALNFRCLWRSWLRPCRECTGLVLIHFLCPASNFLFKFNNSNTRKRCEICSKLTIKTPKWRQCPFSCVSIVDFEQVNVTWAEISIIVLKEINLRRSPKTRISSNYIIKIRLFQWLRLPLYANLIHHNKTKLLFTSHFQL